MDSLEKIPKKSFRVGLNEGVVVSRADLRSVNLFTDGLSGCTALVVVNDDTVL